MAEEKNLIGMLMKALLTWLETTAENARLEKRWHEELMGLVSVDLNEVQEWSDKFQEEWE